MQYGMWVTIKAFNSSELSEPSVTARGRWGRGCAGPRPSRPRPRRAPDLGEAARARCLGLGCGGEMRAAGLRRLLLLLLAGLAAAPGGGGAAAAEQSGLPAKKLRMAYATGPLLKFQIW